MSEPWRMPEDDDEFSLNIEQFKRIISKIKEGPKEHKIREIQNLIQLNGLITHYCNKLTKKVVLADCRILEYQHEYRTSEKLTAENYHVLFVPKGYFKRTEKKHDVFLLRSHLIFEVDLKCITSKNPDTISKRIKKGSEQASRLVLDIQSDIGRMDLIDGLRGGCNRNGDLKQILLFYRSSFQKLNKDQILGKGIFDVLK